MPTAPPPPSEEEQPQEEPEKPYEQRSDILTYRNRRWYVCPVVSCDTIEEHDITEKRAHYCKSEEHPAMRMKILYSDTLYTQQH